LFPQVFLVLGREVPKKAKSPEAPAVALGHVFFIVGVVEVAV